MDWRTGVYSWAAFAVWFEEYLEFVERKDEFANEASWNEYGWEIGFVNDDGSLKLVV